MTTSIFVEYSVLLSTSLKIFENSNVRVYVGPQAERIGAIAFTLGWDIYFAPGRYQADTVPAQQLLGHELVHVVQQRTGRVKNSLGSGCILNEAAPR